MLEKVLNFSNLQIQFVILPVTFMVKRNELHSPIATLEEPTQIIYQMYNFI